MIRFAPAPIPSPTALRLVCRSVGASLKVPFGLGGWSSAEDADLVVLLEPIPGAVDAELTPEEILRQLPGLPAQAARGRLVLIVGELRATGAVLSRLLSPRKKVARSARAAALLAAGYTGLGAAVDPKSSHDLVWGVSPLRSPAP